MYPWLLYLHLAAILGFMLAHGVQVTVMWKQRWEADPERSLALFEALPGVGLVRLLASATVATGLALMILLELWARWWVWLSLLLFAGLWLTMYRYGGQYYGLLEESAARAVAVRGSDAEGAATAEFSRARTAWHPIGLTVTGLGGFALILWMMIFKPN